MLSSSVEMLKSDKKDETSVESKGSNSKEIDRKGSFDGTISTIGKCTSLQNSTSNDSFSTCNEEMEEKSVSKSSKRNSRRRAAKNVEAIGKRSDVRYEIIDGRAERDEKVFELLKSTYPAKLDMDKLAVDKEFSQIVKIWFKEKFKDETLMKHLKSSKDMDAERRRKLILSLNEIYRFQMISDKNAVHQELGLIYQMWIEDREIDREIC